MAYVRGFGGLGDAAFDAAINSAIARGAPPDTVAYWRSANVPGVSTSDDLASWIVDINAWYPGTNAEGAGANWLSALVNPQNIKAGSNIATSFLSMLTGRQPAPPPVAPAASMSTMNTVVLVGGVAAAAAVAYYLLVMKKKKG